MAVENDNPSITPSDGLVFKRLTVMGTGLIGGSFLMACRQSFPDLMIRAMDCDSETLQFLVKNRLADEVSLTPPTDFDDDELILLAAHLKPNLALLETIAPAVSQTKALVTDIGSCKRAICDLGDQLLPEHFIGGHPLAGKEFSGVSFATPLLFAGKPYALCPPALLQSSAAVRHNYQRLESFLTQGLRAKTGTLDRVKHDRYMAYVSHFPQLYAVMLTTLLYRNEPGHLLSFHGAGMDDQLRLAASPYTMWRDIFDFNEDNLRQVLQDFGQLFEEANTVLNTPAMATWFAHANEIHREFHDFRING